MVKCPICNQETPDLTKHLQENPECLEKAMTIMKTMIEWFNTTFGVWWTEVSNALMEFIIKVNKYMKGE